jgi:class 3 adenylate cyclase
MSAMERRIVAVMFTDLVRSTELFDRLSAEQAEEVRRSHFDALREVVEASAGETVKTLGDGIMASSGSLQQPWTARSRLSGDSA